MSIKKYLILLSIVCIGASFTTSLNTKINFGDRTKTIYLKTFSSGDKDIITKQVKAQSSTEKIVEINISRQENTPYVIDYTYTLFDNKDDYQIEMKSVMDPMNFHIADNIEMNYTGDNITYPKSLRAGMKFPNLASEMTTVLKNVFSRQTIATIKNRKVIDKETLAIGSKTFETFIITYTLVETNIINERTTTTLTSQVKEWYSPIHGILKKEVNQALKNTVEAEIKRTSSNYVLVATKIETL